MSIRLKASYSSPFWTPAQIPTALWLDASDASTITTVSGAVSQWNDKSGNSRNLSQSTSSFRPTYPNNIINNLPVIRFDGTDDRMQTASAFFTSRSLALYVVAKNRNPSGDATLGGQEIAVNPDRYLFFTGSSSTSRFISLACNSSTSFVSGVPGSNFYVHEFEQLGDTVTLRVDGNSPTVSTGQATTNLASTPLVFGAQRTDGGGFGAIDIAEIVCLPVKPLDSDRQRIEGYLAHKWGLTANLPNNHPYKYEPPYV